MKKILLFLFFFCLSFRSAIACDFGNCNPLKLCSDDVFVCSDCSWCSYPTAGPEQPSQEDITGKVYNPVLPLTLSKTPGVSFLQKLIKTGIIGLLTGGSILFFFILASGGVKWISSAGDKVKLESAQKQITSGLTGLAILLSVFAIIKLIETLFGIDLLNITLPTL